MMDWKRAIVAVSLALLISSGLTWAVSRHAPKVQVMIAAPMQRVVAVSKDTGVGVALQNSALTEVDWPMSAPLQGAFSRKEDVQNRVLTVPLMAGQPVLARYMAGVGTTEGIVARIPPGMRAVAITVDDVTDVAGFVMPGNFVDVLLTTRSANQRTLRSSLVLEDVRVLASGQKVEVEAEGKPTSSVSTVTLLVSPEAAARLSLASAMGKLQLALRSAADHTAGNLQPQTALVDGGNGPVSPTPERPARMAKDNALHAGRGAPLAVENYDVEVIANSGAAAPAGESKP